MKNELSFNSRIDMWLLIVVLSAVAACLWGIARIWDSGSTLLWLLAVPLAIGVLLPLWVLGSLRYFLSEHELRVRCGPLSWKIAIAEISSISPTDESGTSPAMSFDRLKIEYGDGQSLMIAPEPREEFLRQIEHRRKQTS